MSASRPGPYTFAPIGVVASPFADKVSAPRQGVVAAGVRATIELYPDTGIEHALSDLEGFETIWVLFVFHLAEGFRPRVQPPRSEVRRGVLATRSPHRPNPIGLSAVKLLSVRGLSLEVEGVDLVDGTPVLDIKPYLPYADAFPRSKAGWLEADAPLAEVGEASDPRAAHEVRFGEQAQAELALLREGFGVDLQGPIEAQLSLGPAPHAYRRIRVEPSGTRVLSLHAYRVRFAVEGRVIVVLRVASGYRPSQLFGGDGSPDLDPHRALVERFGVLGEAQPAATGGGRPPGK